MTRRATASVVLLAAGLGLTACSSGPTANDAAGMLEAGVIASYGADTAEKLGDKDWYDKMGQLIVDSCGEPGEPEGLISFYAEEPGLQSIIVEVWNEVCVS